MPLLIQFTGSFVALAAFIATQAGWLAATSSPYLGLNVAGSAALVASALAGAQWGFAVLESVWIAVSAFGLYRNLARLRRRPRAAPPAAGRERAPGCCPRMAAMLREINVDCNDPRLVAEFWSRVLGWEVQEHEDVLWMSESGGWGDLSLVFAQVPERKSGKNRIHLGLSPVGCERGGEVARLRALGAQPVDVGRGDVSWVVLADPEGNEFCVLGRRGDATPAS